MEWWIIRTYNFGLILAIVSAIVIFIPAIGQKSYGRFVATFIMGALCILSLLMASIDTGRPPGYYLVFAVLWAGMCAGQLIRGLQLRKMEGDEADKRR